MDRGLGFSSGNSVFAFVDRLFSSVAALRKPSVAEAPAGCGQPRADLAIDELEWVSKHKLK